MHGHAQLLHLPHALPSQPTSLLTTFEKAWASPLSWKSGTPRVLQQHAAVFSVTVTQRVQAARFYCPTPTPGCAVPAKQRLSLVVSEPTTHPSSAHSHVQGGSENLGLWGTPSPEG